MVEQKKILIRCSDDSVIIMSFVLNDYKGIERQGTPEEITREIQKASSMWDPSRLPIISWEEITDSDIPTDRTFRDAWITTGAKKIDTNMVRAREIHRNHLRQVRQPILDSLDIEYIRADEDGDTLRKKEISDRKKELRDVTQHPGIDLATTPDELKQIWIE